MRLLCILAIFYLAPVYAQIDIVFDMDWTLFYALPESSPVSDRVYQVGNERYRLADGAEEIIEKWYRHPDFRVSFYSGGSYERNKALLQQVFLPDSDISLFQVAHQIKSNEDLVRLSSNEKLHFWERFKKDLALINPDLDNIVIIEDLQKFVLKEQENNVYWLGKTFDFAETYNSVAYGKHSPVSELEWLYERRKLFTAYHFIDEAYEVSVRRKTSFILELNKLIKEHRPEVVSLKKLATAELVGQKLVGSKVPKHWAKSQLSCSAMFSL